MTGPDADRIRSMFSTLARRYDRANTVLSAGIHHLWRRSMVRWSGAGPGDRVLDCATGTGDLAFAFKRVVGDEGVVVGMDFCEAMLDVAQQKARRRGLDVRFEAADVMSLPHDTDSFDFAAIAFGIRNVSDAVQGLREMGRVTRPDGRVLVLEFGQVEAPVLKQVYNLYARKFLPRIGGWVTGHRRAYDYLKASSSRMECREAFLARMAETGTLKDPEYRPLMGGVAFMYRARSV